MYLRSQRRYSNSSYRYQRGGGGGGCFSRILMLLVIAGIVAGGVYVYRNLEDIRPEVQRLIGDAVVVAEENVRQIRATPLPPTPDASEDLTLAVRAWERGAMEDTILYYTSALPALPNDLVAHYRVTMALINQGRYEDAVTQAEGAVTASPFSADAWSVQAMALTRAGRPRDAISSAARALELAPESSVDSSPQFAKSRARALAVMGEAYLALGQTDVARTYTTQALELDTESFEAWYLRGRIAQEVDLNTATALESYTEAYEIAPNMTYLAIWVGRIQLYGLDDREAAVSTFQSVLEQNPGNTLALYELGWYYTQFEGNPSESFNYYSRCVQSDPENVRCLYRLGRVLMLTESTLYNPQSAQEYFVRAHALNPEDAYILYWLAQSHNFLGQCQEATPYVDLGMRLAREQNDSSLLSNYEEFIVPALRACGQVNIQLSQTEEPTTDTNEESPDEDVDSQN
jgi:tetratricopeptide (TPR) repeat protein